MANIVVVSRGTPGVPVDNPDPDGRGASTARTAIPVFWELVWA